MVVGIKELCACYFSCDAVVVLNESSVDSPLMSFQLDTTLMSG